jgi:hypothetical protein
MQENPVELVAHEVPMLLGTQVELNPESQAHKPCLEAGLKSKRHTSPRNPGEPAN